MAKSTTLIESSFKDFQARLISFTKDDASDIKNKIYGQRARLIPLNDKTEKGCEKNLTSIFLASLTLIKEFRNMVSKEIDLKRGGTLHAYTEVAFPDLPLYYNNKDKGEKRLDIVDGLLLVVSSDTIKDAAFFEMKSHDSPLDPEQVKRYIELAKKLGIDKLVTVSNQFVTSSRYSPFNMKCPSDFNLFHLSWHYINTMGKILWEDNDTNIIDEDQKAIMYEVTQYFDHEKSGVKDFSSTGRTWEKAIDGIDKGIVDPLDPYYSQAVVSWIQEERDIALKLSQHLGYVIDSQKKKYSSLQSRIEDETNFLLTTEKFQSEFKIKHAVSNMVVEADVHGKNISVSVVVQNPEGASTYSQLKFVKNQLDGKCEKKNPEKFKKLQKDLVLEVFFKGRISSIPFGYENYDEQEYKIKAIGKEKKAVIKQVRITYKMNYGTTLFKSRTKFIKKFEEQVLTFYQVIVQNLKNGKIATPQIENLETED